MKSTCDAIIIGGGPAGSATAILLAKAGWSVAVLERKEFPRRKVCGEYLSATNWPLLEALGVEGEFGEVAGPEVRWVGLFAGADEVRAELPRPDDGTRWGRALGREHLDTMLLRRAAGLGADVRQPREVVELREVEEGWACLAKDPETGRSEELRAPVAVAAHGSWRPNPLLGRSDRDRKRPGDLFGFKAHFRGADLPDGLMPLLAFPGGYGGMVHGDGGRVSLSCCVRRDRVGRVRRRHGLAAGESVLRHILDSCGGVRRVLGRAEREGAWLSAGPLRPGIRPRHRRGMFRVGNAAGEAHPVIAEGISMAMQSAWLLADRLAGRLGDLASPAALAAVGEDYADAWRRSFAPRLHAAAVIAHWAMSPPAVSAALPLLRRFPSLLTTFAHWSGKDAPILRSIDRREASPRRD